MPGINAKTSPIIPRNRPYPPDGRDAARAIRALRIPGGEAIASGFDKLTDSVLTLQKATRENPPAIEEFLVTDGETGRVLAALGEYEKEGIVYSGVYGAEAYFGDPYGQNGTSDPANAIFRVLRDGSVTVGQNGWLDVLDPFEESAAWIGTQADRLPVTGAVSNGGLIRLTVTAHTLATGDSVRVWDVGGVPNATGIFTVTSINANTIDLQSSVFVGTYTSGGYVNRLMHVTGAANNGSGLIRLTITAHSYESGDKVNVASVGGVPNATGQWIIDVISANTFDLVGSTWGGGYTSGGICLRYFAGMLAQTIAIGESFADYKLRAFANGDLRLRNAEIELTSTSGTTTKTILIDPDPVGITVQSLDSVTGGLKAELRDGWLRFDSIDTSGVADFIISSYMQAGYFTSASTTFSVASSRMVDLLGFSGSTEYGPLLALWQARGTLLAATATQNGDTLGGVVMYGYDTSAETNYAAGIRAIATEDHSGSAHGTKLVLEYTANGDTTTTEVDLSGLGDAVMGASNLTTAGRVVLVSSAGTVTEAAAAGITGSLVLSLTTNTINYKDHAGVNQSMVVVTNATLTANAFTGGIRTT